VTPERWQRVKPILADAFERPASERPGFLDDACGADAALRAELEALLAADARRAAVDEPAARLLLGTGARAAAPALAAGARLGPYEVLAFVGAGGMGQVYRARDTRLEREVAVKILSASGDGDAEMRFADEARAASSLSHPNIVTVFDVGHEGALPYVVSELLEGATLAARLALGPLPLDELLRLARDIAAGLAAAHERGIVHRDLKPENLFVTTDGRVKILDFGLAQRLPREGHVAPDRRRGGAAPEAVLGTVGYMSPEQVRGEPTDARSDVFALGAVLYEMLTGRRAFRAPSAVETVRAILDHDPLSRPGTRPIPPAAARVLRRCLEKDPRDRFPAAGAVLAALEGLRSRGPVPLPAGASLRSRRALVPLAALAVATVLAIVLLPRGPRPGLAFAARDFVLIADFDNRTGNPVFDHALGTALAIGLEQSGHANVVPRPRVAAALQRMKREPATRIDAAVGREVCLRENARGLLTGEIAQLGERFVVTLRLVDPRSGATVRSFEAHPRGEDEVLPALARIAADLRTALGESLASIGRSNRPLPEVTTTSLRALALYAQSFEPGAAGLAGARAALYAALEQDPDFAMAHAALGAVYLSDGYYDPRKGRAHFETALRLARRTTDRERLHIRAVYQHLLTHVDEAIPLYRLYLASYPDDAEVHHALGALLAYMANRPREGIEQYREALRIDPGYASSLRGLASAHVMLGDCRRAVELFEQASALDPPSGARLNDGYGFALACDGRPGAARAVFDEAVGSPALRARGLRSHALLDLLQGRYRSAGARVREAALLNETARADRAVAGDHVILALIHEARGDLPGARAALDRGWRLAKGPVFDEALTTHLGAAYARIGALPRAAEVLQRLRKDARGEDIDPADHRAVALLRRLEGEIELAAGLRGAALERLLLADRGYSTPYTLEALGRAQARSGRPDEARATYEKLVGSRYRIFGGGWAQPAWAAAHHELALLYRDAGDLARSRQWNDALLTMWSEADPDLPLLARARALRAELASSRGAAR
jgi:eukaryotic-like serine/threonine-protein kinase